LTLALNSTVRMSVDRTLCRMLIINFWIESRKSNLNVAKMQIQIFVPVVSVDRAFCNRVFVAGTQNWNHNLSHLHVERVIDSYRFRM
jgi:hypothetical protein